MGICFESFFVNDYRMKQDIVNRRSSLKTKDSPLYFGPLRKNVIDRSLLTHPMFLFFSAPNLVGPTADCHQPFPHECTGCSRKNVQSFTHDKFGTVCSKMKIFAPKCSAEINVYQSMQIINVNNEVINRRFHPHHTNFSNDLILGAKGLRSLFCHC